MKWVLNSYSPRFVFHSPSHLAKFVSCVDNYSGSTSFDYRPKFEHLVFNIFDDAQLDIMQNTCYCRGRDTYSHDDLVKAWAAAVSNPSRLRPREIKLDITPAPGWMRQYRPDWLRRFIQERRITKMFFAEHETVMLHLIDRVHEQFGDGVTVQLSGQLSEKSRPNLDSIVTRSVAAGVDIDFVGDVLPVQPVVRKPQIWEAVNKLGKPANTAEGRWLARLRHAKWSAETQKLWMRVANQDLAWANAQLVTLGQFLTNDETDRILYCPAVASMRRALLHRMAQDLGCITQSIGEGEDRFVRIEKHAQDT